MERIDCFQNMSLEAGELVILAFVSLVASKCQSLILLRKALEYFYVHITIITYSYLEVKKKKKRKRRFIHTDPCQMKDLQTYKDVAAISSFGIAFLDHHS